MRRLNPWSLPLSLFLPILVQGCGQGGVEEVRVAPEEIHGVWTTSDPAYAGRSFEIQAQDLIFDTVEEGLAVYPIMAVRRESGPDGVDFEIDHRGLDGGAFTFTFSFTYHPTQATIVFRNQPELTWVRGPSGT